MTLVRAFSAAVTTGVLAGGCVSRETTTVEITPDAMRTSEVRGATNLPAQFVVVTAAAAPGDCPPALRDPGLDSTLRLQRSVLRPVADSTARGYRAVGDYAVEPRGVYGERPGEGVRVDCSRLRALGIVRL
ncbi:MAG TPA: hypothetical protein VFZ24_05365 [Longimicrobiales bacterium]